MNTGISTLKIVMLGLAIFVVAHTAVGQKNLQGKNANEYLNGVQPSTTAPPANDGESAPVLHKRNWRYTINPSDTLELTFSLTPDYNQTVTVQPDGYIALRDVGTLLVAGQTLPELTESIKNAYSKILRDPVISINPKDFEKPYVTVGGQVGRPGKIDWRGDVTVTQAIALAGGFTDASKHSQVLLFRRVSDEWTEAKIINVKKMVSSRDLREDPRLQPGDMLIVPKNALSKIKPFLPTASAGIYANPPLF